MLFLLYLIILFVFKLVALFVCFADSEFGLVFNIYCFIILFVATSLLVV